MGDVQVRALMFEHLCIEQSFAVPRKGMWQHTKVQHHGQTREERAVAVLIQGLRAGVEWGSLRQQTPPSPITISKSACDADRWEMEALQQSLPE